jgi:hypothetical protein
MRQNPLTKAVMIATLRLYTRAHRKVLGTDWYGVVFKALHTSGGKKKCARTTKRKKLKRHEHQGTVHRLDINQVQHNQILEIVITRQHTVEGSRVGLADSMKATLLPPLEAPSPAVFQTCLKYDRNQTSLKGNSRNSGPAFKKGRDKGR